MAATGFKVRRVFRLKFEDPEFEGMVVRAAGLPMRELFNIMAMAGGDDEGDLDLDKVKSVFGSGDVGMIERMLKLFASRIVEWNLEEDDGKPITADFDGLMSLDMDVAMKLFMAWLTAAASVSRPLEKPSADGANSEEAHIPMEVSLPSLAS